MRIEMMCDNLLTLGNLCGDMTFQLVVRAQISHTCIALHFDEATCDCPRCCIQVKERQIRTPKADFITEFPGVAF
jgi:hypothetical protein